MNEDEAFIRAIVNNPGDDTPRLVYADWLDDHDDPRGSYLRAEHEAAVTGDVARLKELAVGLDPVWVARVSRPPVGVCCEDIIFEEAGPALNAQDLAQFEGDIGLPIPSEYKAFLLNFNGGSPSLGCLELSEPNQKVHWFYSLNVSGEDNKRRCLLSPARSTVSRLRNSDLLDLWDAQPDDVPWGNDVVPIGDSGHDFQLFLAVRGRYTGLLHLHDWTGELCRFGCHGFAPTFTQYLSRLSAGHCGLADTYPSTPLQSFWKL